MWVRRRELVFPQEEAKQQALQQFWGDIAAIVTVRKGGEMDVAVDQVFFDHLAPYIIGDLSPLSLYSLTPHGLRPVQDVPLRCVSGSANPFFQCPTLVMRRLL